jgi:hypothetical protein
VFTNLNLQMSDVDCLCAGYPDVAVEAGFTHGCFHGKGSDELELFITDFSQQLALLPCSEKAAIVKGAIETVKSAPDSAKCSAAFPAVGKGIFSAIVPRLAERSRRLVAWAHLKKVRLLVFLDETFGCGLDEDTATARTRNHDAKPELALLFSKCASRWKLANKEPVYRAFQKVISSFSGFKLVAFDMPNRPFACIQLDGGKTGTCKKPTAIESTCCLEMQKMVLDVLTEGAGLVLSRVAQLHGDDSLRTCIIKALSIDTHQVVRTEHYRFNFCKSFHRSYLIFLNDCEVTKPDNFKKEQQQG